MNFSTSGNTNVAIGYNALNAKSSIDGFEQKLKSALEYLGENWVLHKNYKFNPKHGPNGYIKSKNKIDNL